MAIVLAFGLAGVGLCTYAILAGLSSLFFERVISTRPCDLFNTYDKDQVFLGWLWPLSVPITFLYMTVWVFCMRPVFRGTLWLGNKSSHLPALLAKLPSRLKAKAEFPKARIHR